LTAALFAAGAIDPHDADACGGCFHGPPQPTEVESVVTAHRMVFAVSTSQTVLWDQIEYSGNPAEFAWVLPVHPGARVELSHDSWLASLDAATQPTVIGPSPNCPGVVGGNTGSSGCGFGGSSVAEDTAFDYGGAADDAGASSNGVSLINQSVVGPYETVTLRASQGDALETWLTTNGFLIPTAVEPTLAAYASEGFDFIALKLRPGEGIRAMQPVRVVTPGADASLPLRMVAAGIGASVGIELYVLSEGRYHTTNFPDAEVDYSKLTWDPYGARSNYSALVSEAMSAGDGTGWVTEFAGPIDVSSSINNPLLESAYEGACRPDYYTSSCDAAAPSPIADAASDAEANDGGDADVGVDAGGIDAAAPACPTPPPPALCDDFDVALGGMPAAYVWVTRLRANLPANALAAGDLRIGATLDQSIVSNQHSTSTYSDPKYNPCPGNNGAAPAPDKSSCACRTTKDGGSDIGPYVLLVVAIGLLTGRLRKRAV
jgi:hypothetical protein